MVPKRPSRILERLRRTGKKTDIVAGLLTKSTKRYYDANADHYEKFHERGLGAAETEYREGYGRVEKTIANTVKPGELVLDAGCGVGRWSVLMAEKGAFVVGADQSEAMLEKCRRRATRNGVSSNVALVRTDALDLAFPDKCFDGVTVNWLLSHIDVSKNADFMEGIARVVKPGGWLVLSDSRWNGQMGGREQVQVREVSGRKFGVYKYYYEPEELGALVRRRFGPVKSIVTTAHEVVCVARRRRRGVR